MKIVLKASLNCNLKTMIFRDRRNFHGGKRKMLPHKLKISIKTSALKYKLFYSLCHTFTFGDLEREWEQARVSEREKGQLWKRNFHNKTQYKNFLLLFLFVFLFPAASQKKKNNVCVCVGHKKHECERWNKGKKKFDVHFEWVSAWFISLIQFTYAFRTTIIQ